MTLKRYETAILFDPELPEDARKEFLVKLSGIVAGFKGEVLKIDDWGNRKLAYPIRKKSNGFYTFLLYTGNRGVVEEVERNIKISEGILRHLTTLHTAALAPKVEAAAPPAGEAPADTGTPAPETPAPETPQAPAAPAEA
jgi:small subunit ribosomal protein S6